MHPYKGNVSHLPSGSGKATLHWVDLAVGRRGIALASQVKDWRNSTARGKGVVTDLNMHHEELRSADRYTPKGSN